MVIVDWVQLPVVQLGALGVLLAAFWLVYTGRLIPRSTMDKIMSVQETRITEKSTEAAEWRATAESATAASKESAAQLGELLHTARTTNAIVESLARGGEARDVVVP